MNDRIQFLMAEAGIDIQYLTNTKQIVLLEKFAELIVNECIEVIKKEENMPPEVISPKEWHQYAVVFKEHFGMK